MSESGFGLSSQQGAFHGLSQGLRALMDLRERLEVCYSAQILAQRQEILEALYPGGHLSPTGTCSTCYRFHF
jgi:hypothetical protein